MVPPAGQVCAQLPRENFVTRRFGSAERASVNIRKHCPALFRCAAAACFIVHRSGSSGAGHFKCGAEFFSQTSRQLCKCAKIAAMVRPLPFLPGGSAAKPAAQGSKGSPGSSHHCSHKFQARYPESQQAPPVTALPRFSVP